MIYFVFITCVAQKWPTQEQKAFDSQPKTFPVLAKQMKCSSSFSQISSSFTILQYLFIWNKLHTYLCVSDIWWPLHHNIFSNSQFWSVCDNLTYCVIINPQEREPTSSAKFEKNGSNLKWRASKYKNCPPSFSVIFSVYIEESFKMLLKRNTFV